VEAERDPRRRFTGRVALYSRHRPGYPAALFEHLAEVLGIGSGSVVAEIGSGTGILTEPLLERGIVVHAVEPNLEMREAAESQLGRRRGFRSVDGSAESTGLPVRSVDAVLAAQAFHWFRPEEARREFDRILRPGGKVALIWNRRRTTGSFLAAYEKILEEYATDYRRVDHRRVADPAALSRFFGAGGYRSASFDNAQDLDWDGLRGRLLSSSFAPLPGQPGHDPMIEALRRAFEAEARHGLVRIEYDTEAHWG
jgi:SAM-dependent methyltransferase